MTFNPIAALKSVETLKFLLTTNKIVDLGVQTPTFNHNLIDKILSDNLFEKQSITDLRKIKNKLIRNEKITSTDFFKAIGFKKYTSIDINEVNNSLPFDLNEVIEEKYNFKEKFDLVINNGTGEHVFNQYSLFKNIHNLCDKNGIMLHILPFIDWINHGFYSFHPISFGDLAAANNYKVMKISFANRYGSEVSINNDPIHLYAQIKPKDQNSEIYKLIEYSKKFLGKNILVICILKKIDNNQFKVPLQGKYLSDLKILGNKSNYDDQGIGSSQSKGQLPDHYKRIQSHQT